MDLLRVAGGNGSEDILNNMDRKPIALEDIRSEVTRAQVSQFVHSQGRKLGGLQVNSFRDILNDNPALQRHQFWIVHLRKEKVDLFVNTEGYNYARYVSRIIG